jgi:hypothetical protein
MQLKKKNMKSYKTNTVIHFGKHMNKSILQVCKSEPSYISWCLINLDHFYLSEETLEEIKRQIPNFKLSGEASKFQKKKELEWEAIIEAENTDSEDYYHDPYEDYGSSGEVFGWYNGWSDDAIYDAFEGDPDATWNVD